MFVLNITKQLLTKRVVQLYFVQMYPEFSLNVLPKHILKSKQNEVDCQIKKPP